MKRILSVLLVAVMLFGAVSGLIPVSRVHVYAAEEEEFVNNYITATDTAVTVSYATLQEKLTTDINMKLMLAVDALDGNTYQLYCNAFTGEVIYYNATTGEGLTTNPYDMGANEAISDSVKAQLMSQVLVSYKGNDGNLKTMDSFTEAARRNQILVKIIKNGFRVQYTIGRENAEYLMPGWITAEAFQRKILDPFEAYLEEYGEETEGYDQVLFFYNRLKSAYTRQNPNDPKLTAKGLAAMQRAFPITAEKDPSTGLLYDIYTVDDSLTDAQKNSFETLVKTYCPDYTYDDLAEDNAITGYVGKQDTPPLFKLSLEYTLNPDNGALDIRLPGNSILYDETLFTLENISTLNYLGAGRMSTETYNDYVFSADAAKDAVYGGNAGTSILKDGYVFYPDGSGTLFEFSDLYTTTKQAAVSWSSKVYGADFAYYTVSGQHQETIRLPAYGVVSTDRVLEIPMLDKDGNQLYDENGRPLYDLKPVKSGYLAILEDGDAMTNLAITFGATRHNYASVYPVYYPRPKDTYDLADSISVSGSTEWTVVADRKYTGNYRTRIILLSDTAEYAPSWVGMATAYRSYLEEKEVISRKTVDMVESQIPLYIEVFGAYETTKQILSMPVDVKVPLTSFEDVKTIYADLSENSGISNINFKLTGFANGGMLATYPAKLKWEKSLGGAAGFRDLVADAKDNSYGVYPEFDFSYISNQSSFDGVSLKKLGARTVDNRYCSKKVYDAVYQQFDNFFDMCVSTNLIMKYYDKFSAKLSGFSEDGEFGLSVSTLGSDLNSNFDKENPINREEAKRDVVQLLGAMKESYKTLMLSGGNSYALPYADHILNMPLSGSNYRYASASVPFMAMVLHGYIDYAGSAINMSGDTEYSLLKSLESGAYPYYLLSYNTENTMLLKKDESLSKYYSVRYDIWRWSNPDKKEGDGTIVEQYNKINSALADLQTAIIKDHQFIRGERVLTDKEIAGNKEALKAAIYLSVTDAITAEYSAMLDLLRTNRGVYKVVQKHDAALRNIVATARPNQLAMRLNNYISDNLPSLDADTRMMVRVAYQTGGGLEDLVVVRALDVKVNVSVNLVLQSIAAMVGDALSAEEMLEVEAKVRELIDLHSDNATFGVYDSLAAIFGSDPIAKDVALFNQMIYAQMPADRVAVLAKDQFSVGELSDEKVAAVVALVAECSTAEQVLAVVTDVDVKYDFNETTSDATDGDAYDETVYTLKDERLVMVTYEKLDKTTVRFVLNYNIFTVKIILDGQTYVLEPYGWMRLDDNSVGGEG